MDYNPAEEIELAQQAERDFRMAPTSNRAAAVKANEERTMDRFTRRVLVPFIFVLVGVFVALAGTHAIASQQSADADWTVPPCSVYAYTAHPDLPAYTRTDACIRENADGGLSLVTGDSMWKAAY